MRITVICCAAFFASAALAKAEPRQSVAPPAGHVCPPASECEPKKPVPKPAAKKKPAKKKTPPPPNCECPPGPPGESVRVEPEPPGKNCEHGGVKLTSKGKTGYVCNGAPGPEGPRGQAGFVIPAENSAPGFRRGVGLLGFAASAGEKNYAWGWGPAFQLQVWRNPATEFTFTVGYAGTMDSLPWSPGKTRAWMFETGMTWWPWERLGLMLGAHAQTIGIKPDWERGTLLGITPGLASQWFMKDRFIRMRFELKGFLGVNSFESADRWVGSLGFSASAVASF